jgi:hypothetical protein
MVHAIFIGQNGEYKLVALGEKLGFDHHDRAFC